MTIEWCFAEEKEKRNGSVSLVKVLSECPLSTNTGGMAKLQCALLCSLVQNLCGCMRTTCCSEQSHPMVLAVWRLHVNTSLHPFDGCSDIWCPCTLLWKLRKVHATHESTALLLQCKVVHLRSKERYKVVVLTLKNIFVITWQKLTSY